MVTSVKKTGFIIQARTGSTRYPNKILTPLSNQKTILESIVNKLRSVFPTIPLVVATTVSNNDDVLVKWCKENGIICERGSEDDVLLRMYDANLVHGFDTVIRICSDNYFLSTDVIKEILAANEESDYDYIAHYTKDNIPTIKTHYGFFCEAISKEALKKASENADAKYQREHVTPFFYEHENLFKIKKLNLDNSLEGQLIRCTLDDQTDFQVINTLINNLGENARPEEIIQYVSGNNELADVMSQQIKKYNK